MKINRSLFGGAGRQGGAVTNTGPGGAGGIGKAYVIWDGTSDYYGGGGGGGGGYNNAAGGLAGGTGGNGGGATGGTSNTNGESCAAGAISRQNSGGGGGGAGGPIGSQDQSEQNGSAGSHGIVIVRYAI